MHSSLFIDTSDRENQTIKLDGKTFKVEGDLVLFLAKTLKKEGISLEKVREIKINRGPGSFTGLRTGAAVANALRYALGLQKDPGDLILPKYGKPPRITSSSASRPDKSGRGSPLAAGGKRKRVR